MTTARLEEGMSRRIFAMLAAVALAVALTSSAHATVTFKVGTLAPGNSPWGKEFKRWANEVSQDTGGELDLDFQWNGQAGDEALMVQKIRSGQLDGAGVSAFGLAQTGVTDVLIFNAPGLFANWAKLDLVRDALRDDLNKQFEAKGFSVLGWGDGGAAKTMTVGFEAQTPSDLRGNGVFFSTGDPIQPKIYSMIGGITPKVLTIGEILPSLASGSINVVTVPPLVAEQLQWTSHVTHLCTQTVSFYTGALIVSSPRLQALAPKLRDALTKRAAEMSERVTLSIRNLDANAFARLKATKITYELADADKRAWSDLFRRVNRDLRGTVFTPTVFDRVMQLAGTPAD
jgi:TRAP-type C4-dicarboxylate transport system substrate-binding protein